MMQRRNIKIYDMAKIKTEAQWQAEDDARTLARYQEIMSDSKRRNAAMKQAKLEAKRLQESARRMTLASGGRLKK